MTSTYKQIPGCIQRRESFTGFSMSGRYEAGLGWHSGRLIGAAAQSYYDAKYGSDLLARSLYVVRSYGTPIGWEDCGVWTVPLDKYSSTTSRHQSVLTSAIREA